jgi:ketosteroid isomerase-like protein
MNMRIVVAVCAAVLVSCRPASLPRPTDEEAKKIIDAAESTFTSGDPVRIMEHYANDAVLFDPEQGDPTDDHAVATKWTESFVAMKPTKFSPGERRLQFFGDHLFITSGVATVEFAGKAGPITERVRYTDVYRQQPDRSWLIVHEHLSKYPAIGSPSGE